MRKTVVATAVIALVMAMAGASSASAYKFSPEGASVTGNGVGTSRVSAKPAGIGEWGCQSLSMGEGKVSGGKILFGGPRLSTCVGNPAWVALSPSGNWQLSATGPSTAQITADTVPSGGTVMTLNYGSGGCVSTVKGPITLHNLGWSNSTHQLTLNTATSELPSSNPSCSFIFGTGVKIEAVVQYWSGLTIVP
jgi:hypothetical protein